MAILRDPVEHAKRRMLELVQTAHSHTVCLSVRRLLAKSQHSQSKSAKAKVYMLLLTVVDRYFKTYGELPALFLSKRARMYCFNKAKLAQLLE